MNPDQILSPSTPTSWIMAHLRADAALVAMLGDGPIFPNPNVDWGEGNTLAPIFKAGEVPPDHPARFVVVKPPVDHDTDYYANLAARRMDSTYLVWCETQTDKLPPGHDLDMVLEPAFKRIIRSLYHVTSTTAFGGHVLQVEILGAYTPPARMPQLNMVTEGVRIGQMGVQLALISTV